MTTLEEIVDKIENKYGMKGRVWVFDRGVVSEDNLQELRQRGAYYLVGTPRRKLADFERELLEGDWQEITGKPGVRVQLLSEGAETFVLARRLQRARKESGCCAFSSLACTALCAPSGVSWPAGASRTAPNRAPTWPTRRALSSRLVHAQRGRASTWPGLVVMEQSAPAGAKLRQGAYLLRTNLDPMDPDALWHQYVQLTEVEAAFRALKSELAIRPIWHRIQRRVEAHILVAFLGYCLWVCLKQKLKVVAESITPARVLESLRSILMVEVWFDLRNGGQFCLARITEAERAGPPARSLSLELSAQPLPRINRIKFSNHAGKPSHFPKISALKINHLC